MIRLLSAKVLLGALLMVAARSTLAPSPPAVVATIDPVAKMSPPHSAALRRAGFPGPVSAMFTRIIDGDTFEARIRIWFGQEITTLVRVRGIDAPELKSRCQAEAEGARIASEALSDFLGGAFIQLRNVALDKYGGRVLATVLVSDPGDEGDAPEDVASLMLATGTVRPYGGGRRQGWCGLAGPGDQAGFLTSPSSR